MPSPFETFECLLRKLARLMALDPDEKDEEIQRECDDIRDHMDGPWLQMTEEQQEMARQLSADLYLEDFNKEKENECS
jgi:hypothetical protein